MTPRKGIRPMVVASILVHGLVAVGLAIGPLWVDTPQRVQAYQVRLVSLPVEEPVVAPKPVPPVSVEPPKPKPKVEKPRSVQKPKPKKAEGVVKATPTSGPRPVPALPEVRPEPPPPAPPPPAPDQVAVARPEEPNITMVTPLMEAVALKFPLYMKTLERKVDANWSPPGGGLALTRDVLVTFTIIRDGSVEGAEIEQSSGDFFYDQAALRSVLRSAPFPPFPPGFPDDKFKVYFSFYLNPDRLR